MPSVLAPRLTHATFLAVLSYEAPLGIFMWFGFWWEWIAKAARGRSTASRSVLLVCFCFCICAYSVLMTLATWALTLLPCPWTSFPIQLHTPSSRASESAAPCILLEKPKEHSTPCSFCFSRQPCGFSSQNLTPDFLIMFVRGVNRGACLGQPCFVLVDIAPLLHLMETNHWFPLTRIPGQLSHRIAKSLWGHLVWKALPTMIRFLILGIWPGKCNKKRNQQ